MRYLKLGTRGLAARVEKGMPFPEDTKGVLQQMANLGGMSLNWSFVGSALFEVIHNVYQGTDEPEEIVAEEVTEAFLEQVELTRGDIDPDMDDEIARYCWHVYVITRDRDAFTWLNFKRVWKIDRDWNFANGDEAETEDGR